MGCSQSKVAPVGSEYIYRANGTTPGKADTTSGTKGATLAPPPTLPSSHQPGPHASEQTTTGSTSAPKQRNPTTPEHRAAAAAAARLAAQFGQTPDPDFGMFDAMVDSDDESDDSDSDDGPSMAERASRMKSIRMVQKKGEGGVIETPVIYRKGSVSDQSVTKAGKPGARINNYSLMEKLGEGAFAEVRLAIEDETQIRYAMKIQHLKVKKWEGRGRVWGGSEERERERERERGPAARLLPLRCPTCQCSTSRAQVQAALGPSRRHRQYSQVQAYTRCVSLQLQYI